jgi:hypothetical protein
VTRRHVAQPTRPGGALAVLVAVAVVAVVSPPPAEAPFLGVGVESLGLGIELLAVGVLAAAAGARRRGHGVVGRLLLLAGVAVGVGGLVAVVAGAETLVRRIVVSVGVAGVGLLGAGVAPVRSSRSRGFVTAGAAAVTVAVVLSGLLTDASVPVLLGAMVATVVAWDVGEGAVSLGEQVGVRARTWSVELVHGAATAAVGAAVVAATLAVREADVTGLPLAGLLLLLCAAVALLVALSN